MKKILSIILCLLIAVGIFASCGKEKQPTVPSGDVTGVTSPTSEEEVQRDIRLGYFKEKSLNPFKTDSPLNRNLTTLVYDSLFVIEDDFTALPLIAESFEMEDNKLSVIISDDLYFSDGSPISTADVVYSFKMAKESPFYAQRLSNFNTAVKGEESVIFTMKHKDIYAESNLVFPIIKIGTGGDKYPIGSGRYKFKKSGGVLYLKANESSTHAEDMSTPSIRLVPVSADKTELYLLQTGDLTAFYDDLSDGKFTKINANMVRVPTNNLVYLGFNNNNKFLKDPAVKKAIELCTDKKSITDSAFNGYCRIAHSVFNPDWAESLRHETSESEFSVMKAEEVLEKANYIYAYKNNKYRSKNFEFLKLSFIVNEENKPRVKAAEAIAKSLRSAGFEISLKKLSFSEYEAAVKSGSFDLYLGEVALSPSMDLSVFFDSEGELSAGVGASSTVSGAYFDFVSGVIDYSTFIEVFTYEKPLIPICYRDGMACFSRGLTYEGTINHYDLYKNIYSWEIKR